MKISDIDQNNMIQRNILKTVVAMSYYYSPIAVSMNGDSIVLHNYEENIAVSIQDLEEARFNLQNASGWKKLREEAIQILDGEVYATSDNEGNISAIVGISANKYFVSVLDGSDLSFLGSKNDGSEYEKSAEIVDVVKYTIDILNKIDPSFEIKAEQIQKVA